jgi:cell division protein FtsI/penicillin-binding protein 2
VLAAAFATAALILGGRLIWLGSGAEASEAGPSVHVLTAPRGTIWDTRGELLAAEAYGYEVGIAPENVEDAAELAVTLGPIVKRPPAQLAREISEADQPWLVLDRSAPAEVAEKLSEAGLPGLFLTPLPRRVYALGPKAAHITGFLNMDGQAHYGVEAFYDDELRGQPGRLTGALGTLPSGFRQPRRGVDLILTIDRELQSAVSDILVRAVEDEDAAGGTAIVMNPHNGDVLALTSVPAFDPNDYARGAPDAFLDPAVSRQYEPGSVIKAMTMAAALESETVTKDSSYEDPGYISYGGAYITNWDQSLTGTISMTQLLQHSLNVGAVHLAAAMGADTFYKYMRAFGFASPTGVDLAAEIAGSIRSPEVDDWTGADLATNSFGQGMASTPLQVAAAMGVIANDGVLMRPRLVRARADQAGEIHHVAPVEVRRVISAETALTVRQMLRDAVEGYAVLAVVPGFSAAGKTGTSQIAGPDGYEEEDTITSFVGFIPALKPEILVYVKIDRPRHELAADAAAPVFRDIAEAAVTIRDITPDDPSSLPGAAK